MRTLERDLWRLQLLDELRRKLVALDYEPMLDPDGSRRTELERLIERLERRPLATAHLD